jgi:hypothetical protein
MGICMRGDLVLVERILLLYCGNEDMKHSSFPSGMIHWIDRQIYGSNNMAVIAYVNQRIPVVTRGALRTSTDHPIAYALSAPPDIEPNPDLLRSLFAEMDDWEAYQYLIIVGTMVDLCIQHRRIPTLLSYCEKDTRLKALLLGSSDLFNQVFRYYTGLAPAREPCVAVAKYYVNALYGLVAVLPVFPGLAHLAHSPIDSCEILFSARLIFFNDGDNLEQYVALSEEYKILKAAIQTYLT